MTTIIRLDASALKHLIDSDPDFALELKTSVLAEAYKHRLKGAVADVIRAQEKELREFTKKVVQESVGDTTRHGFTGRSTILTDELQEKIKQEANHEALRTIEECLSDKDLQHRLDSKVKYLLDENVLVRSIKSRVMAALEDVLETSPGADAIVVEHIRRRLIETIEGTTVKSEADHAG